MEPTLIHIATHDDVDAEHPAVGYYVRDGRDIHGEFADESEAEAFIAYLMREARADARQARSCRYPGADI
jgi:hypothetical protein